MLENDFFLDMTSEDSLEEDNLDDKIKLLMRMRAKYDNLIYAKKHHDYKYYLDAIDNELAILLKIRYETEGNS